MSAVIEILEGAFFEAGLVTELQSPTPRQAELAMKTLATTVSFMYGTDVGEYLEPWPLGNYGRSTQSRMSLSEQTLTYPVANSRLIAVNEAAATVYLDPAPSDGARMGIVDPFARLVANPVTINGNGRSIEGAASVTVNTNGATTVWFYRADTGNWAKVTPLLITDEMPFPSEYDEMFKILMAMRLNPQYGRNVSGVQGQALKMYKQQFTARYVQSAPLVINPDISFPTLQSYDNFADVWLGGGSNDYFNRGGYGGGF